MPVADSSFQLVEVTADPQPDEQLPVINGGGRQLPQLEEQIATAGKQKWKYLQFLLASLGISVTIIFSGEKFASLTPGLFLVSIWVICVILGLLFYLVYKKIIQEAQLRLNYIEILNHSQEATAADRKNQIIFVVISACLTFVLFVSVGINDLVKHNKN